MARVKVPITPEVLVWAVRESGFTPEELAKRLKVSPADLNDWMTGEDQPTLTFFRKLSGFLKRPAATFLLPSPPPSPALKAEFRQLPGSSRAKTNPKERLYLRDASRFQRMLSWILHELKASKPRLPQAKVSDSAKDIAIEARQALGIKINTQMQWESTSEAFHAWREALEKQGVIVFLFSMGGDACRGFSIWDERAPVIAINTWWNVEARVFSLFHEYGHLITKSGSVCPQDGRVEIQQSMDPTERWCERFAASFLIPRDALDPRLKARQIKPPVTDLNDARRLAQDFKVSLKATVLRLIAAKYATWDLYSQIPSSVDLKKGGGGGTGRNRTQIKEDQYGKRASEIVASAIEHEILEPTDALTYLDIHDADLSKLERSKRTLFTE